MIQSLGLVEITSKGLGRRICEQNLFVDAFCWRWVDISEGFYNEQSNDLPGQDSPGRVSLC